MPKVNLIIFFVFLTLSSCKKEKTSWESNWVAPLVHGRLTLNDLVDSQYQTTNSENYITIVYSKSVYSFSVDTLIDLPDTTIKKKTAVNFPNLTVNPAFSYGDNYDQAYILDQIQLKQVIIKSGQVEMTIRSPWAGKTKLTFNFPKMLEAGSPFIRDFFLDAGTQANPATQQQTINMQGFNLDLTGVSGNLFNTISGSITVASNEAVSSFDVTNTDSIEYDIAFSNLLPYYARGYFGSYALSDTLGFALPFMDNVLGGMIDIDSIKLNIIVKNGFNLVAQSKITLLEGYNTKTSNAVQLNFPLLNTSININPASGGLYDYIPSEYPILLTNTNSNVSTFIENLSDSIKLGYELLINPNGNVTGGADELFPNSSMDLYLEAEYPLSFGANNLTLTDTFKISYNGSATLTPGDALITLDYTNGFPISANPSLYLLDDSNSLLSTINSNSELMAGIFNVSDNTTTATKGKLTFSLTKDQLELLKSTNKIAFIVSFTTDSGQVIKINANAFIDFNLRTNLPLTVFI